MKETSELLNLKNQSVYESTWKIIVSNDNILLFAQFIEERCKKEKIKTSTSIEHETIFLVVKILPV